ncbi:MAG: hypothetical protein WKF71_12530 [Pyrinomonadaceae bacterium]
MTQEKDNQVNNPTEKEDEGSDMTSHDWGTGKGEEMASKHGKEAGRYDKEEDRTNRVVRRAVRTARDSTSVNQDAEEPIDPAMPHMPPA